MIHGTYNIVTAQPLAAALSSVPLCLNGLIKWGTNGIKVAKQETTAVLTAFLQNTYGQIGLWSPGNSRPLTARRTTQAQNTNNADLSAPTGNEGTPKDDDLFFDAPEEPCFDLPASASAWLSCQTETFTPAHGGNTTQRYTAAEIRAIKHIQSIVEQYDLKFSLAGQSDKQLRKAHAEAYTLLDPKRYTTNTKLYEKGLVYLHRNYLNLMGA